MNRAIMDLSGNGDSPWTQTKRGRISAAGGFQRRCRTGSVFRGPPRRIFVGIESKVADKLGVIEKFTYRGVAWYQRDIDIGGLGWPAY